MIRIWLDEIQADTQRTLDSLSGLSPGVRYSPQNILDGRRLVALKAAIRRSRVWAQGGSPDGGYGAIQEECLREAEQCAMLDDGAGAWANFTLRRQMITRFRPDGSRYSDGGAS